MRVKEELTRPLRTRVRELNSRRASEGASPENFSFVSVVSSGTASRCLLGGSLFDSSHGAYGVEGDLL